MADRYQALSRTRAGALVIRHLGLPDPVPLARYRPGEPLLSGPVVVGGEGAARAEVIAAVAAAGGEALTAPPDEGSIAALVYDATWIASPSELVALPEFFAPVIRRLRPCGRVVVVGTSPRETGSLRAAVAQRALEGFTRSLGKEVGRGSTVQLVCVSGGGLHALTSTLQFLLSPKSAYVSGQVIRVGPPLSPDVSLPDLQRPLDGKVALVTGAARGIGAAIARTLHRDGARVVGVDVPGSAEDLNALATELGGERLSLDITSVDAAQRIARRTAELAGGVDVVVHNAGITRDRRLANMSAQRWTPVLEVNLDATLRITSELLDQGLIRPGGRIVAVSSIAGIAGNVGQTNYAASKAGTIGFVTSLAPEVAPRQVTVNAVAPGFIETRMTASLPLMVREAGRRLNSMSQGGRPVDVAETVAWLAAPGSSGITGSVVRVCGQSLLGA